MLKKIVLVRWEDSHTLAEGWEAPAELHAPAENQHIYTIGILWHEDKRGLTLVGDYDPFNDFVASAHWIPRSQLRSIRILGKVDVG